MRILGIDTSGKVAAAALYDSEAGCLLAQQSVYTKRTHSQVILPLAGASVGRYRFAVAGRRRLCRGKGSGVLYRSAYRHRRRESHGVCPANSLCGNLHAGGTGVAESVVAGRDLQRDDGTAGSGLCRTVSQRRNYSYSSPSGRHGSRWQNCRNSWRLWENQCCWWAMQWRRFPLRRFCMPLRRRQNCKTVPALSGSAQAAWQTPEELFPEYLQLVKAEKTCRKSKGQSDFMYTEINFQNVLI